MAVFAVLRRIGDRLRPGAGEAAKGLPRAGAAGAVVVGDDHHLRRRHRAQPGHLHGVLRLRQLPGAEGVPVHGADQAADRRVLFFAYLAIPLQYIWVGQEWYGMFIIFVPVYMFLLLPA